MIPDGQNRVFHYAILASLALHALLFLGFPDLISSARRAVESFPPPILARLIAPEPVAPPPAAAPPVAKEKPPAPPKAAKPLAIPTPAPEAIATAKPEPVAPVLPVEATPEPAIAEAPPAPVSSAPPSQPAAQPGAAAAAREARTIGEYRLQLIEAANRIKDRTRYPPLARDNNWTGKTNVRVAMAASGTPAISVQASSGHPVLDEHALVIFRQATREVSLPQELRGKAFAIEVRMDFTLKD